MNDYILFMHDDAPGGTDEAGWEPYLRRLRESGCFDSGSAIGGGLCVSKAGEAKPIAGHLSGFLRVQAQSLDDARAWLEGNPVYEAGGTVEIRELPRSD